MRRITMALALLLAVGCNCDGTRAPDGGGGGGGTGGGGQGGGSAGGTAGGAGGGSAGGTAGGTGGGGGLRDGGLGPRCVGPYDAGALPVGQLPFSEFCPAVRDGLLNFAKLSQVECNEPLVESDFVHLGIDGGPSDCQPDGGLGTPGGVLAASIDAGRMAYDPAAAFACRELGRATSYCPSATVPSGNPSPCDQVFRGLVPRGAACSTSEECVANHFCRPAGLASCEGTCEPRLSPGAACDPDRELCEVNAPCLRLPGSPDGGFRCESRVSAGGACQDDIDCRAGLRCSLRRCVVPGGPGAPCADPTHLECAPTLGCVTSDGGATCQLRANLGEPCSATGDSAPPCFASACVACSAGTCVLNGMDQFPCLTDTSCRSAYFCDRPAGSDAGTCAFRARRGEGCLVIGSASDRGSCLYLDDFCQRSSDGGLGTCAVMPTIGEPCGDNPGLSGLCQSGYCHYTPGTPGTCRDNPLPGQACGQQAGRTPTCATGRCLYDAGVCQAPLPAGTACVAVPPGSGYRIDNCETGLFCGGSSGAPRCEAQHEAGRPCLDDVECAGGLCDRVAHQCSAPCSSAYDNEGASCRVGCPNGLKDMSFFLFFALAAGPLRQRRRR